VAVRELPGGDASLDRTASQLGRARRRCDNTPTNENTSRISSAPGVGDFCTACGSSNRSGWPNSVSSVTTPRLASIKTTTAPRQLLEDSVSFSDKPEFSHALMQQLNQMYTFMEVTVNRQRTRHSSDISLMMRKVDKDLKDTFINVRDTFSGLTEQLSDLVREVESNRRQVRSIQDKYEAAKGVAEKQAEYVNELEAVLDCQGVGMSETLKRLSNDYVSTKQQLAKITAEGHERTQRLKEDNRALKQEFQAFREQQELLAVQDLPLLPEMTASWTRHMVMPSTRSSSVADVFTSRWESRAVSSRHAPNQIMPSEDSTIAGNDRPRSQMSAQSGRAFRGSDIVQTVMANCDARRQVPRIKKVRAPWPEARGRAHSPQRKKAQRDPTADLQKRLGESEARCIRQHNLIKFASSALLLLGDIFTELKNSGCLAVMSASKDAKLSTLVRPPSEILSRIVALFGSAILQLGNLHEVITALAEEAARPSPLTAASAPLEAAVDV